MADTMDEYIAKVKGLSTEVKRSAVHDIITKMLPDSNMARASAYGDIDTKLMQFPGYAGIAGFVDRRDPSQLFLSQAVVAIPDNPVVTLPETVSHETAHVQQIKSGRDFSQVLTPNIIKALKPKTKELGLGDNAFANSREFMANVQSAEAQAPEGQTVWSTPLGKAILEIAPEKQRLIDSLIAPHLPHMTETPPQDLIDIMRSWLMKKLPAGILK